MTRAEYLLSCIFEVEKPPLGKKWKDKEAEYRSATRPAGARRDSRKDRPDFAAWKDPRTDVGGFGRQKTGWKGEPKGAEWGKPGSEKVGYFTKHGGAAFGDKWSEKEQSMLDKQGSGRKRKMTDKEMRAYRREQRKEKESRGQTGGVEGMTAKQRRMNMRKR